MAINNYFAKHGYIYGVGSVERFGRWSHTVYRFDNLADAQKWLHAETYCFAERELCSKSRAVEIAGKSRVDNAQQYYND